MARRGNIDMKQALKPTKAKGEQSVRLRICCLQPLDPAQYQAEFGLQEKSPGDWLIHAGKRTANGAVHFQCECRVSLPASAAPDFAGPFVHGKRGERFLYLSWKPKNWQPGEPEPGPCVYLRRMKVHLRSITAQLVREALRAGAVIETTVEGRARDGGPACASVPLIGGWKARAK
jgi:hypothetical protein